MIIIAHWSDFFCVTIVASFVAKRALTMFGGFNNWGSQAPGTTKPVQGNDSASSGQPGAQPSDQTPDGSTLATTPSISVEHILSDPHPTSASNGSLNAGHLSPSGDLPKMPPITDTYDFSEPPAASPGPVMADPRMMLMGQTTVAVNKPTLADLLGPARRTVSSPPKKVQAETPAPSTTHNEVNSRPKPTTGKDNNQFQAFSLDVLPQRAKIKKKAKTSVSNGTASGSTTEGKNAAPANPSKSPSQTARSKPAKEVKPKPKRVDEKRPVGRPKKIKDKVAKGTDKPKRAKKAPIDRPALIVHDVDPTRSGGHTLTLLTIQPKKGRGRPRTQPGDTGVGPPRPRDRAKMEKRISRAYPDPFTQVLDLWEMPRSKDRKNWAGIITHRFPGLVNGAEVTIEVDATNKALTRIVDQVDPAPPGSAPAPPGFGASGSVAMLPDLVQGSVMTEIVRLDEPQTASVLFFPNGATSEGRALCEVGLRTYYKASAAVFRANLQTTKWTHHAGLTPAPAPTELDATLAFPHYDPRGTGCICSWPYHFTPDKMIVCSICNRAQHRECYDLSPDFECGDFRCLFCDRDVLGKGKYRLGKKKYMTFMLERTVDGPVPADLPLVLEDVVPTRLTEEIHEEWDQLVDAAIEACRAAEEDEDEDED